jgi:hypothetical protein
MSAFTEGVSAGNQSLQVDRQEKQQRLKNYIKGFELNEQGQYAPNERGQTALDLQNQKLQQELMVTQEQNKQIQSIMNKDTIEKAVNQIIAGNASDVSGTIKQNPGLYKIMKDKGVDEVMPVDFTNDTTLLSEIPGMSEAVEIAKTYPEVAEALKRGFFKVRKNGKWQVNTTESLYKVTGQNQYRSSKSREVAENSLNKIRQVLAGVVSSPTEDSTKQTMADSANMSAEALNKQMTEHFQNGGDWLGWEQKVAGSKATGTSSASNMIKELELEEKLKDRALSEKMRKINPTEWKEATLRDDNLADKEQTIIAKQLQGDNEWKGKPQQDLAGMEGITRRFIRVTEQLQGIDRDAFEKANKIIARLANIKSYKKRKAELSQIRFDTSITAALAEYIKLMSGTAVTESEFDRYNFASQAGDWSTHDAALASLEQFTSGLIQKTNDIYSSNVMKYPHDMRQSKYAFTKSYELQNWDKIKTKTQEMLKAQYDMVDTGNVWQSGIPKDAVQSPDNTATTDSAIDLNQFNGG